MSNASDILANPANHKKRDGSLTASRLSAVCMMMAHGVPVTQVAAWAEVTEDELLNKYAEPIEAAKAEISHKVASTLLDKAMDGDLKALIFWAKSQMGWTDQPVKKEKDILADQPTKVVLVAHTPNQTMEIENHPEQDKL